MESPKVQKVGHWLSKSFRVYECLNSFLQVAGNINILESWHPILEGMMLHKCEQAKNPVEIVRKDMLEYL